MGDFAKALGTAEELQHEGKTFRLAPMKQLEVCTGFEQYLEDQAQAFLERQRPKMNPIEYDRRCDRLAANVAAGMFSFLGETAQQSFRFALTDPSNKAAIELLYLRLREGNLERRAEITRDLAAQIIEDDWEKVVWKLRKELEPDPNEQSPPTPGGDESESKPSSPA